MSCSRESGPSKEGGTVSQPVRPDPFVEDYEDSDEWLDLEDVHDQDADLPRSLRWRRSPTHPGVVEVRPSVDDAWYPLNGLEAETR
jgi:hypothetical protein